MERLVYVITTNKISDVFGLSRDQFLVSWYANCDINNENGLTWTSFSECLDINAFIIDMRKSFSDTVCSGMVTAFTKYEDAVAMQEQIPYRTSICRVIMNDSKFTNRSMNYAIPGMNAFMFEG